LKIPICCYFWTGFGVSIPECNILSWW